MRVTNKMLSNTFLSDMRTNLENMKKIQQQMTSGKEIRKPSDDPFKVARSMQLHTGINANAQYNENISDTINWLDTTDTALGQSGDALQRVRELLISAGNASYSQSERTAVKNEINEIIGEFSQTLNTNFDGKYIFGGTRATSKPLDTTASNGNTELINNIIDVTNTANELNMIASKLKTEISQGVTMDYNVSATEVLKYGSGVSTPDAPTDLKDLFKSIVNHLDGNNADGTALVAGDPDPVEKLSTDDLQGITDAINNLLKIRSEVGAKQNRMDSASQKNGDENFNMTEILSKNEDIDITEKTMEYATMQTVYIASLQTSAKVLQPSLLDYL